MYLCVCVVCGAWAAAVMCVCESKCDGCPSSPPTPPSHSPLCRREEELLRYHKQGEIEVMLSMTPHFNYSSSFDSSPGGDGGGGTDGSNGGGGEAQVVKQRRMAADAGASLGG